MIVAFVRKSMLFHSSSFIFNGFFLIPPLRESRCCSTHHPPSSMAFFSIPSRALVCTPPSHASSTTGSLISRQISPHLEHSCSTHHPPFSMAFSQYQAGPLCALLHSHLLQEKVALPVKFLHLSNLVVVVVLLAIALIPYVRTQGTIPRD